MAAGTACAAGGVDVVLGAAAASGADGAGGGADLPSEKAAGAPARRRTETKAMLRSIDEVYRTGRARRSAAGHWAHKKAARALDQAWAWAETGRRAQASGRLARAPLVSAI